MSSVFSLSCDKLRLLGDKRSESVRCDFGQCFFASDIRHVTIIYGYGYFVHFTPYSRFPRVFIVLLRRIMLFLKKKHRNKTMLFYLGRSSET